MRICFLGHFTAGGTERATFIVANGLAENPENEIFILSSGYPQNTFYLKENIHFEYLNKASVLKRNLQVYKYLKANKIDVLVTVEAMTGLLSIFPAFLARCKHVVWEHANYFQNQGSRYIQKIRQLELFIADAYVVLTKRDLNNFKNHFKIRTNLLNIYNVADNQAEVSYNANSKTIISAGHINRIKNFIVIPDIAKIVFEKHPDWIWHIYGAKKGAEYEKLQAKVNEYGLQNHILFMGRCEDMPQAYRAASMYVMTSLQEGLPMVLLEAKSHKLPLVSFDIETGPDEIIRDGVNGYLVPAYDAEAMAEKICSLIESPSLRQSFSDASPNDLSLFDSRTIIGQWQKLFNNIMGK